MIRFLFSLFVSLGGLTAAAAQPLVTPAELAARLGDSKLRIVDIRESQENRSAEILLTTSVTSAGAQHAPYSKWRGPAESPGRLPALDSLTALIQQLGIDRTTPVVVVYEGKNSTDFGSAARVYWTLKTAGVATLSVLNGGMTAWRAAGLPVSTETSVRRAVEFPVHAGPALDCDARRSRASRRQSLRAFARRAARGLFRGRGAARGRQNARDDRRREERQSRRLVFEGRQVAAQRTTSSASRSRRALVRRDQPTISFCNTGHWAATTWFVLVGAARPGQRQAVSRIGSRLVQCRTGDGQRSKPAAAILAAAESRQRCAVMDTRDGCSIGNQRGRRNVFDSR